jgi:2-dehydropantoate 2-reductase
VRFAVIGVGGVGGYFGARLAEAGHEVTFVARGVHLAALRAHGLHVHSPKGDFVLNPASVTEDAATIGTVDCVILGVKAWQVLDAARSALPLLGPETFVLPLQNGVEAVEQVSSVLGTQRTLGGVAKIISFISAPGHIQHAGAEPAIVVGELDGRQTARLEGLQRAFEGARGVSLSVAPDIQLALWEKFLFITGWGGIGAVARAPIGILRAQRETRRLIESGMQEIERIARARGVDLREDIVAQALAFVDAVPADGTSSMQRDIAAGRPSELGNLSGAVVRFGAQLGVATPVSCFVHDVLLPLERRARGTLVF